ncbi:MAG: heme-copper oxidase subunit III [Chloroflexi bacterium]|nr:MAG: heme-copper oxidase subunit III [Chloroflexota bacterium]TMG22154.1 MAG: heme-copper oxidase subunit III [Chloroflexota bacterium]TMG64286.1 MAG: heme-copper oxidase subunit III [Chloroflexota bacterium]
MAVASLQREPTPEYPAIKPGMMGMYIFLASEVMFFGSLFAMYFYMVGSHNTWPPAAPSSTPEYYVSWWPIPFVNTIVLLSSGVTCHFALEALSRDNRRRFFVLMITTIVLGLGFEFGQLYEFINAFSRGLNLTANTFASAFFTMTGFHGAHVLGGLVLLTLILYRAARGQFSSRNHVGPAAVTLYWHFVDVVWIFLFGILYLGVTAFK